jgi:DNA-directed RNA polymerase subunit beta'
VQNAGGKWVAVSRSGELIVQDEHGRDRERYKVPFGAVLAVDDGTRVNAGDIVANWDPHTHPIVTEVAGKVAFTDLIEGQTVNKQTDAVTGLSTYVVLDPKQARGTKDARPMISLIDDKGNPVMIQGTEQPARYNLPAGAIITV